MPIEIKQMETNEIQSLIKDLIERTGVQVSDISILEENPLGKNANGVRNLWFKTEVNQPHFFLDREGEALFALNHLVKRIVESKMPDSPKTVFGEENVSGIEILIDVNDFHKKRIENIHAIAHMMAERARYFKSSIEVDPMPAFERRIVHEFLSTANDLKTESTGFGPSRRVVIKYTGAL